MVARHRRHCVLTRDRRLDERRVSAKRKLLLFCLFVAFPDVQDAIYIFMCLFRQLQFILWLIDLLTSPTRRYFLRLPLPVALA